MSISRYLFLFVEYLLISIYYYIYFYLIYLDSRTGHECPLAQSVKKKKKRGVNKKMKSKKDTKEKNKLKIYYLINPKLLF